MMSKNVHPHGEQLSAYIDGMLDVGKTRGIAEHLRACPPCRAAVGQLQETKTLLHQMPAPARPGPQFWNDAYRRLRVDDRERATLRRSPWDSWRGPEQASHRRWAAGLAAAAAVGAMIAGPLTGTHNIGAGPPAIAPLTEVPPDVSPDVSSLVESHTDFVSATPLDDPDGQKMIAADARKAPVPTEAAGYADIAF
jgi:anti-sigma factor RsiW